MDVLVLRRESRLSLSIEAHLQLRMFCRRKGAGGEGGKRAWSIWQILIDHLRYTKLYAAGAEGMVMTMLQTPTAPGLTVHMSP